MIKVYIASPYTAGDVAINVRRQLECADKLIDLGYAPFAPLYSHFQHMFNPKPYKVWTEIDLEWVAASDCVLRLEGDSPGADAEVAWAKELMIPVFTSIDELNDRFLRKKERFIDEGE